jgi:SAM-dependent methyltransferase
MTHPVAIRDEKMPANDWADVKVRCPRCKSEMGHPVHLTDFAVDKRECARCGWNMYAMDGIWRAILPARANQIGSSLQAYETVREAEGRWSDEGEFYRLLPWRDTTGRFSAQWEIRARSFDVLRESVLPDCIRRCGRKRMRVLDLGAGNCWMSYRLALFGHFPVAVDIGVGSKDGLGAARHYRGVLGQLFPRYQAEMDWLPFADKQFDVVVYNASFHYAQDYATTLREAVRVLRPNGAIVIVDSPTYRRESDGEAMMREKSAEFERKFGTDSGDMNGQAYLTPERLANLERIGISWRSYSPWYGWRWALRPIVARINGRRRPSQFHIYLGTLTPETTEAE